LGFFAFVQWLCFRQWRALRTYADQRNVRLMGDIPIGVSWHSTDTFFDRDQFHLELCGGSPPEPMVPDDKFFQQWGQNWGIPLYRWDRMEKDGFAWWKQRLTRVSEVFRMFRIDHILGFYRIYSFPWPPHRNAEFIDLSLEQAAELTGGRLPRWSRRADDSPENEAQNLADGDLRLKAVLQVNEDCEVIAEDLGWVPGYVRPHLAGLGIAGFRIPHWDSDHGRAITGDRFPECSFATYSTHDHDPVNTVWRWGYDAIHRNHHSPNQENARDAEHSRHTLGLLAEFAGIPVPANGTFPPYTDGVQWRLIKALFASNSRHAVLCVTELFGIDARINRPGTQGEHNWKFRMPWTIEEIRRDKKLSEAGRKLAAIIGVTRRA
jgi:4-alpha-glucanotransferase